MADVELEVNDESNDIELLLSDTDISLCEDTIIIDADISVENIEIDTDIDEEELCADFGIVTERVIQGDVEVYHGQYDVTPRIVKQSLETAQKYLEKNVTVNEIPLYEVDNPKGTTIYIGDKINGL